MSTSTTDILKVATTEAGDEVAVKVAQIEGSRSAASSTDIITVVETENGKEAAIKTVSLGGGGGSSADVETLKDQASVLQTSIELSEELSAVTVVMLDELVAMPIDGRPSYKKAGATVYAENGVTGIISTIDDVNGTAEIVTVSVSGADAVIFREW